jgi:hypothetical protein
MNGGRQVAEGDFLINYHIGGRRDISRPCRRCK